MTLETNARIAGATFFAYTATAIAGMILFGRATAGIGTEARLASVAAKTPLLHLAFVLALLTVFEAVILAVTLHALTRDEDPDLAMLALACRVIEGVLNAVGAIAMLALAAAVATSAAGAPRPDAVGSSALARFLLGLPGLSADVSTAVFAFGSAIFSYLFVRARSIPAAIAWSGMLSSALLVVAVLAEHLGLVEGMVSRCAWLVLPFELALALWLVVKGVRPSRVR